MATRPHQDKEQNLDHHRVTQAQRGANNSVELRAGLRRNDPALDKLPEDPSDPLVGHELREQQQWQGYEKADVCLHVIKKWDFNNAT